MRLVASWFGLCSMALALGAVSAADLQPVSVTGGVATLSPANTKIEFVGTHSGDKPDPRTGGFAKFSGKLHVDSSAGSISAISADIDTTSLYTPIPKLTDHLKTADFFEVREYPTAKFQSTAIKAGKAGSVEVTGKLTLHGVTKQIRFPAKVQVGEQGVSLVSQFSINRSEFGMTYGAGKVDDKVSLNVVVGQPTATK